MVKRPVVPRTIKPLKPAYEHLQIISATEREGIVRETGETIIWTDLPAVVKAERGIITTNCAANVLQFLEERHGKDPLWQVRVTVREKTIARFDDRIRITKPIIGFLGFMAPREKGKRRESHYWQILDPTVFLDDPKASMTAAELMRWAVDVRAWCRENGLRVKPTAGGLAGQLLRHPQFYPNPRRRIPGATNDRARNALPGNHYELRATMSDTYCADYIDQSSAHHSVAAATPLPDDNLYALGFYHPQLVGDDPEPKLTERRWTTVEQLPADALGLLWARVWIPAPTRYRNKWDSLHNDEYRPEWAGWEGERHVYIFTNELDYLREIGGRVLYVTAGWLSRHKDTGVQAYAKWALDETTAANRNRREWLKPTLLTTYGLLAVKPSHFEVGWRRAKGKVTERPYPIGGEMMPFQVRRTTKPIHPRTAHVIQRGMIEAETRLRSIRLANTLQAAGEHVLCIYGDGLLVKTAPTNSPPWREGDQPELLPAPWRIKERLTGLRFLGEQSFRSREMTRLPGVPAMARKSLVRG